jgi:hypothetical protein
MFKRLCSLILIASIPILLANCSNDDDANPIDSAPLDSLIQFDGITETDDLGYLIGGDLTDWCYNSEKSTSEEIPSHYALYPAFPNSSYYSFTIIYDLPVASEVHLVVIDTSESVIRELVNEAQPAGRYRSGWDIRDAEGNRAEPGIYRVIIAAGEFECYGDIEVLPVPEPDSGTIIIHTRTSDNGMLVSYDAPSEIGGMWLIFIYDGIIGTPVYDRVTWRMTRLDNTIETPSADVPDTLKILISTPLSEIRTLPIGINNLCSIPVESGGIALDYIEISDGLGNLVPAAIIKSP